MSNEPAQTTWTGRGAPPAEVEVTVELVQSLLNSQHPDLADQPLCLVDAGWDNAMFRLGERLAVRLPRRKAAAQLVLNEQAWLPRLADLLTLPAPVPVRSGQPGGSYPWHWSVVPWFAGTASDVSALNSDQAARLAKFLRALHVPAPAGAPLNTVRGVPLMQRRLPAEERMQRLATETDFVTADIRRIWNHALEAPLDVQSTWLHGDLHAQNVLVEAGVISAVIDWGDICQGDRATDLSAIWMVLDNRKAREEAMRIYGDVSDATWSRARGWALMVATILLDTGLAGNQRHAAMGARVYARLAEGP